MKNAGYKHQVDKSLPLPNETVMVVTRFFYCLGYHDGEGVWHHEPDGARIEDVKEWYPLDKRIGSPSPPHGLGLG